MTKKDIKQIAKANKWSIRKVQRMLGLDATGNFEALEKQTKEYKSKLCSLKDLRKLNQISIEKDYNRNLYIERFAKEFEEKMKERNMWNGEEKTYVLLVPMMFHHHKHLEPCETHIRTEVFTNGLVGSFLTLDLPIREFEVLADIPAEHTRKIA